MHVNAGEEFGQDAGKRMIVDKSCYGLKTSSARFHDCLSAKLRRMAFCPICEDFVLWIKPKKILQSNRFNFKQLLGYTAKNNE